MTDLDSSLPPSVRTAGDSWTITELVGATALGVAAARAAETAGRDPLIRDEFAGLLVSSAGPAWARLADPEQSWLDDDPHGKRAHRVGIDYQAVRTHYFDEYFDGALRAGIRQVVILAAGLDSRAYRLNWPAGTTVYEIDQPKVLEYKTETLQRHGATPPPSGVPSRSTCVTTGPRPSPPPASRPPGPPPGWPKDCCPTCRATPRTGCSRWSPRSAPPAARSPSRCSA